MNGLLTTTKPRVPKGKYPSHKEVFAQLKPEQVKIVETQQIHGSKTSKDWLDLFEDIIVYNQALGILQSNASFWITVLGIPLGLLIFFLGPVAIFFIFHTLHALAFILPLVSIIIVFSLSHRYLSQLHSKLLADYFQDIIVPLMVILHEETAADTCITLRADLRHQKNKKHFVKYMGRSYEYYRWQAFHLSTQLYNHVSLDLNVKVRLYAKTNKSKAKRLILTSLSTQYPKKYQPIINPTVINGQVYKVKYNEKPKKYTLRLSHKLKLKSDHYSTNDYSDLKLSALVKMIRESYRVAHQRY